MNLKRQLFQIEGEEQGQNLKSRLQFLNNQIDDQHFGNQIYFNDENSKNIQNMVQQFIQKDFNDKCLINKKKSTGAIQGQHLHVRRLQEIDHSNQQISSKRKQSDVYVEFKEKQLNSGYDLKRVESSNSYSTNVDEDYLSSQSSKGSSPSFIQKINNRDSNGIFEIDPKRIQINNDLFSISDSITANLLNQESEESDEEWNKQVTLEEYVQKQKKQDFIFDPENGGGRRRRLKKISRIDMIFEEEYQKSHPKEENDEQEENNFQDPALRPFGIDEQLYQEDPESKKLIKLNDCRNPDLNTINHESLAQLILDGSQSYMIIDCRFDYEYMGGHIKGAINMSDPQNIEDFFFSKKQKIESLMTKQTIIIFHCEFSQQRGPKMYRTLRDLDRRLNLEFYPQLFYTEIYILEGGYKEFYEYHSDICNGTYIQMENENFKDDCREKYGKSKRLFKQYSSKEARSRLLTY